MNKSKYNPEIKNGMYKNIEQFVGIFKVHKFLES